MCEVGPTASYLRKYGIPDMMLVRLLLQIAVLIARTVVIDLGHSDLEKENEQKRW